MCSPLPPGVFHLRAEGTHRCQCCRFPQRNQRYRTITPAPAVRRCCTVLASPLSTLTRDHLKCIILKTPCVLPSGHLLDSFARAALWDSGLDYLHGTGHGVGCFLNVHEGPCGISYKTFADEPLEAGMIVSDGTSLSAGGCLDTTRVPLRCVSHIPRRVRYQHVVTETI